MKKVLITGGTGYLGRHLAEALSDQYDVTILGRRDNDGSIPKIKKIRKDICALTTEDISGYEVVYHLAALFPNNCTLTPEEILTQNLKSTHHLLDLIAKHNHPIKLIFSSTAGVYGRSTKKFSERKSADSRELYSCSKACCEQLIYTYAHKHPQLKYLIFRIANLYGPGQEQNAVIPETIKKILSCAPKDNAVLMVKNGSASRDFIYIDDCVRALVLGLEKDLVGTYNLGMGKGTKISALVSMLIRISKKEIPITIEDDLPDANILNTSKLKKEGWAPQTSLTKGLKQTYLHSQASFQTSGQPR